MVPRLRGPKKEIRSDGQRPCAGEANALLFAVRMTEQLDHPDARLAETLTRLRSVNVGSGRLREAETAYLRGLAIWERNGPERPPAQQYLERVGNRLHAPGEIVQG